MIFKSHHLVLDNKLGGDFTYIFPWDDNIFPKG